MFRKFITWIFSTPSEINLVGKTDRFNVIYQKMLNTRWYITIITLLTLLAIFAGILTAVVMQVHILQEWKELLFLLLGAFIGSYNRVIDFWFNNSQRDDKLIEKMDQEDDSETILSQKLAIQAKENPAVVVPAVVVPATVEAAPVVAPASIVTDVPMAVPAPAPAPTTGKPKS